MLCYFLGDIVLGKLLSELSRLKQNAGNSKFPNNLFILPERIESESCTLQMCVNVDGVFFFCTLSKIKNKTKKLYKIGNLQTLHCLTIGEGGFSSVPD